MALGMLAVCGFVASRWLAHKGLAWAANATTIAAFVLAIATVAVPLLGKLLGKLSGAPPLARMTLPEARADYADALAKQWAREDQLRRVYDPWPLPVRWRRADGQAQQFADISDTFAHLPAQRMVILGPAGAGKSVLAIKLVRDLLASRKPGDRVPVLLSAATWTRDCTLTEWVTEELLKSNPSLDVRIRTGTGTKVWLPKALAESGLIPVIDGLDELPPDRWATVIAEVNAFGSDYPLVLTSRPAEFYAATASRTMSQAAVIELEPLAVPEIKRYLSEATDAPAERWERVLSVLDAEPDGVLARTLATPLMIWLARTVYQTGDSRPDELLDPVKIADRAAMEAHLVAAFVPAAYAERQTQARPGAFRCSPAQAERWLRFLAGRLDATDSQEIAWWRLPLAGRALLPVSMALRAVLNTCILWEVAVWALTRRGYWRDGTYVGHGHLQDLLLAGPLGRAVRPLTNAVARWLAVSVLKYKSVSHLSGDIDNRLRYLAHLGLFSVALIAAVLGIGAGIISMFSRATPAPRTLRVTWRKVLWGLFFPLSWCAALAFLGWTASVHDQSFAAALRTEAGWSALLWLALSLARQVALSLKTPIEVATRTDPAGLLRADRRAYLANITAMTAGFGAAWLWAGGTIAIADGLDSARAVLVLLVLGGGASAWARYVDARLRLAALRRLPWRAISFLDDAHRRGVLRQTGAVYQFRHIRLQEQLAAGYSPWPRPVVSVMSLAGRCVTWMWPFLPALIAALPSPAPPREKASASGYATTLKGHSHQEGQRVGLLLPVLGVAALTIAAFALWPGWIIVLVVIADLPLAALGVMAFDQVKAADFLPSVTQSVHVAPDAVEIIRGLRVIRLTADDIERIAVRPIGNCWFSYAVYAKVRPAAFPPEAGPQDYWLPLFWTPAYTSRVPPALISALAAFGGERLDHRLSGWIARLAVVEYEAGGTVEVKGFSAALGRYLAGLFAALAVTAVSVLNDVNALEALAYLADLILLGTCAYQLSLYRVRARLPPGPWSFRVAPDGVEITQARRVIRLSAADIETIEFRSIRGKSTHIAVFVQLRPGAAAGAQVKDDSFPVYWTSQFDFAVPAGLLMALAVSAPGRLSGLLKQKAERAMSARPPVYRGA